VESCCRINVSRKVGRIMSIKELKRLRIELKINEAAMIRGFQSSPYTFVSRYIYKMVYDLIEML